MERSVFGCYREYAPREALRKYVRAFFSFVPYVEVNQTRRPVTRQVLFSAGDSFSSPLLADGNASLVFNFGRMCRIDGVWQPSPAGPRGQVIGPMSGVGPDIGAERDEMVGVYFQPAQVLCFTHLPACELADRIVAIEDLWGATALPAELGELDEADRIDRLEAALLLRIGDRRGSAVTLDVPGLAAWVSDSGGRMTVERLADAAGVSRQHLTRMFRERVGVTPKLYCRLARFQSGLAYARCGKNVDWSDAAIEMGYADQSHMIAEFRQFSSLTPQGLAGGQWFHPFIERAIRPGLAANLSYVKRARAPSGPEHRFGKWASYRPVSGPYSGLR